MSECSQFVCIFLDCCIRSWHFQRKIAIPKLKFTTNWILWVWSGAKMCKTCRTPNMLQNEKYYTILSTCKIQFRYSREWASEKYIRQPQPSPNLSKWRWPSSSPARRPGSEPPPPSAARFRVRPHHVFQAACSYPIKRIHNWHKHFTKSKICKLLAHIYARSMYLLIV